MLKEKRGIFKLGLGGDNIVCLAIFVTAALVRFAYFLQIYKVDIFNIAILDSEYYNILASKLAVSKSALPALFIYVHPLYIFFLSSIYSIFGVNISIVYIIQFIMGSFACVLIYLIATKVYNKTAAVIAAGISIFYLPFIFYEGQILSASLEAFILLIMVYFSILSYQQKEWPFYAFMTGLCGGLFLLVRANGVVFAPLIGMAIGFNRRLFREKFKWVVLFFMGLAISVAVDIGYNYKATGRVFFLPPYGGQNFYIGNNPEADGFNQPLFLNYIQEPFSEPEYYRREVSKILGKEVSLTESSDYWFSQGIKFILQSPFKYASLLIRKTLLFINSYEICDNIHYYFIKNFSALMRSPLFSFIFVV